MIANILPYFSSFFIIIHLKINSSIKGPINDEYKNIDIVLLGFATCSSELIRLYPNKFNEVSSKEIAIWLINCKASIIAVQIMMFLTESFLVTFEISPTELYL